MQSILWRQVPPIPCVKGQYGGNTYVVDEGAAAAANLAADDVVVKLTGTLGLSTSAIAAGVLTFA
ncbi:MAG: hypothetical protein IPL59_11455 [Candidatus Competibacteraceae bacterium]|nr:hypothetical protein [Candidatus Competibacteraceae bacterium]